jgi:sodium/proline symporter
MNLLEITTFIAYFIILISIILITSKKQKSDTQFVLGNRSLNFYLTALSAHASEMGNWLFMGYPALIFSVGVFGCWAAIGLIVFMFLNWQFIAPKIRVITEKYNSLTLNDYFEKRFNDKTKQIRIIASILSLVFFLGYISAGLVGLGIIIETLFGINYSIGIFIGFFIIVFYVYIGGYNTVALIDLIQGFFLLFVVLFIPIVLIPKIGGMQTIVTALETKNLTSSLFPKFSFASLLEIIFISCGWGLGYFGQPHIITKFMGIKDVKDMGKAKYLGISWQTLALGAATFIGLIGITQFQAGTINPELISLKIVKNTFLPFFSGLILCAILAATTNVMAAQILVVASSLAEDFYKGLYKPLATPSTLLKISRISVILVGLFSLVIAYIRPASIYELVLYSWSGLGASFGPLLLVSLYSTKINKYGAIAGILTGGIVSAIWPLIDFQIKIIDIPPIIPGFLLSLIAIFVFSSISKNKFEDINNC